MRSPVELGFAAVLLLLIGYLAWPKGGRVIGRDAAHRLVQGGALLLDVRTPEEFARGHLPGARNVPVQVLESRLSDVGDPAAPVVVYCRSGARSARAKTILQEHGFSAVSDLGGMARY